MGDIYMAGLSVRCCVPSGWLGIGLVAAWGCGTKMGGGDAELDTGASIERDSVAECVAFIEAASSCTEEAAEVLRLATHPYEWSAPDCPGFGSTGRYYACLSDVIRVAGCEAQDDLEALMEGVAQCDELWQREGER